MSDKVRRFSREHWAMLYMPFVRHWHSYRIIPERKHWPFMIGIGISLFAIKFFTNQRFHDHLLYIIGLGPHP